MIPIGKSKQTVVEHLRDMLADPLCLDEMTGYQEKAVEKVIALLDGIDIGRLEAICDAERDGRVVVLPAKPGDIIYRPEALQFCWVITKVEIYEDEIVFIDDSDNTFRPDDIGKTVFLSREEAEKAT